MTGVEILSSETIYNTIIHEWWFPLGFVLALAFFTAAITFISKDNPSPTLVCFLCSIVFLVCACLGGSENRKSINHTKYKVTIDDSVSMNEFMDKYEILDQEGKIYTVKEKE